LDDSKPRIFIVDDDSQDQKIHAATLRAQGYDIITAENGQQALQLVESEVPELFLIAAKMTAMDGFTLCGFLKQDARLVNVPVIFVTADPSSEDIDRGYAVGGVDYIRKPCHLSEFLARVRAHVRLYQLLQEVARLQDNAFDLNPLTRLPGNNTIVTTLQGAIEQGLDMTVIYADLDNFKAYNDHYGFSDGDDLLLFTAETLQTAIRTVCNDTAFLGHVGGDDFVIMVQADEAEDLASRIINQFDRGAPAFYSDEDAARGMIETSDRQGNPVRYPLASLSLAGVNLRSYSFKRHLEVASVCAEVKHMAKSIQGSVFFMDRRGKKRAERVVLGDGAAGTDAGKADAADVTTNDRPREDAPVSVDAGSGS
jgi:DNA-binding response OmpR family regulator